MTMVIPSMISFERWANFYMVDASNVMMRPPPESEWKSWAEEMYKYDENIPNPSGYADWRTWARAISATY